MRRIGVVTVARSDFGIYLPLLTRIRAESGLELQLIVSGMHLSPEFGLTTKLIEAAGFGIDARVEMLVSSDSPEGIAKSMGLGLIGYAQSYANKRPDILVVLGDRFEMHCAALAALPFNIPVAHIHGGELTFGAIDDALRHSMTKLSHLHFVATSDYAGRVVQMGEAPWRVTNCGALSLDNLRSIPLLDVSEMEARFGLHLDTPPIIATFHPVTLEFEQAQAQFLELLAALDTVDQPIVFTAPNADTGGRVLFDMIEEFVATHRLSCYVENFGTQGYFSLLAVAAAMVGNSSSGIIEAPSFKLPVVNVGTRQEGRLRAENVIDVGHTREEIARGLEKALGSEFREKLRDLVNPYDRGGAAHIVTDVLKFTALDNKLLMKRFHDVSAPVSGRNLLAHGV